MRTLTQSSAKGKELNVPLQNVIFTEKFQETIKDTTIKHKEIMFGAEETSN